MVKPTTSDRKLAACRENSLKSTGPRSAEGKAIVALNALTHGVMAKAMIIKSGDYQEDESEYEALLAGIIEDWAPVGITETFLCEKIVASIWRLRRALRYEASLIGFEFRVKKKLICGIRRNRSPSSLLFSYGGEAPSDEKVEEELRQELEVAKGLAFPDEKATNKIIRYITSLDKEIFRAMSALATLRQGKRSWRPCEYTRKVGRQDKLKSADVEQIDGTS